MSRRDDMPDWRTFARHYRGLLAYTAIIVTLQLVLAAAEWLR